MYQRIGISILNIRSYLHFVYILNLEYGCNYSNNVYFDDQFLARSCPITLQHNVVNQISSPLCDYWLKLVVQILLAFHTTAAAFDILALPASVHVLTSPYVSTVIAICHRSCASEINITMLQFLNDHSFLCLFFFQIEFHHSNSLVSCSYFCCDLTSSFSGNVTN